MTKKEGRNQQQKYYICEECGFLYKEKEWAQKCQDWCRKYNSCSIEITKHATQLK